MRDWWMLLTNTAAGGLRLAVGLLLISRLLKAERPGRMSRTAALSGGLASALLMSVPGVPDICRMAWEALWMAFCARRWQRADGRMSLFLSIFYEIGVSLWQFLLAAGLGLCFRSPLFLEDGTGRGQIAVWLLHGLLALLAAVLSKKREGDEKNTLRLVSGAALAGFVAVITLSQQAILVISDDTLSRWTILSMVLLMGLLAFHMNRQYEVERELARLKSEQAEGLERDYRSLNRAYEVHAKLFHDLHNHVGVLRQLLLCGKYGEAVEYLEELQAPLREMAHTAWTGDETVDYLINSKAAAAEAGEIRFQVQVEFPRRTGIRGADLCAILGNLLDNGLEAARQVEKPEERFVRLTVRRINQMLVIKVENSFQTAPVESAGQLKSTKMEGGLHGWGLKSARSAAEKYEGTVQTSREGRTFRAVATLSCHGVSSE